MTKTSQTGIAHLGLVLLILIVAVIGFVGYKLEQSRSQDNNLSTTTNLAQTAQSIPTISSKSDLNTAQSSLNGQNVDGDLNPSSFDQDVSSLQ